MIALINSARADLVKWGEILGIQISMAAKSVQERPFPAVGNRYCSRNTAKRLFLGDFHF